MIITICDAFDLQKIADSGQCFRCRQLDDGRFRFITGTEVIYLKQIAAETYDVSCSPDAWDGIWTNYFDLSCQYGEACKRVAHDAFLSRAAAEGSGIRILRQDPWETLISFIISQRKRIPAIQKSVEALARLCGEPIQTPFETVYSFPAPAALCAQSDQALSAAGLGYRLPYVRDAAEKVSQNAVLLEHWSHLEDNALFAQLKTIRGVGDKVANCVMLFAYGRTSRVPVDTWIEKIIQEEYDGNNIFLTYGVHAGILQQYAFYYAQHHRPKGW